jgi:aspartate dehydrogenase
MDELRVGLIGYGSIGRVIADELTAHRVPGVRLVGILHRTSTDAINVKSVAELIERGCEVVVETAGHKALRQYGLEVLTSGADLVVLSAGALADTTFEQSLTGANGGKLLISTGAIGGLDLARAFAAAGALTEVSMATMTTPAAVRDFVDADLLQQIMASGQATTVASGTAREIATMFPKTSNIAATVALATLGLDHVQVTVGVDPVGRQKRHELSVTAGGSFMNFTVSNDLSVDSSQTSAVTPFAVIRLLSDRVSSFVPGV